MKCSYSWQAAREPCEVAGLMKAGMTAGRGKWVLRYHGHSSLPVTLLCALASNARIGDALPGPDQALPGAQGPVPTGSLRVLFSHHHPPTPRGCLLLKFTYPEPSSSTATLLPPCFTHLNQNRASLAISFSPQPIVYRALGPQPPCGLVCRLWNQAD